MTAPRIVVPAATYAISRRCILRKLLLTPFDPVIHQGIQYALALAQHKTGVRLHGDVVLSNHAHSWLTIEEPNLPVFLRLYFGESAKFIKTALAHHGFEPPERIWNADRPHVMRLLDVESNLRWGHYVPANVLRAGLAHDLEHYPGFVTAPGVLSGTTITIERPPLYFDPRWCPDTLELRYSLPPILKTAFGRAAPVIYHLDKSLEATTRACKARGGTVLDPDAVKRQHPWAEPRTARTLTDGIVPSFMVSGGGAETVRLRVQCAKETTAWRERHETARHKWRDGDRTVEFPFGSYAMRVHHGACIESADAIGDAIINAPGTLVDTGTGVADADADADANHAPLTDEARHQALDALHELATTDLPPAEETLAQRIVDGAALDTDLHAQPPVTVPAAAVPTASNTPGAIPSAPVRDDARRVVLRGRYRPRRPRSQERTTGADRSLRDDPDPDPPPD